MIKIGFKPGERLSHPIFTIQADGVDIVSYAMPAEEVLRLGQLALEVVIQLGDQAAALNELTQELKTAAEDLRTDEEDPDA